MAGSNSEALGIKINSLFYKYYDSDLGLLKDINIEFDKGSITAIIGASGSGKSTLLKLIAGLMKPSSGEIILSDESGSLLDHTVWHPQDDLLLAWKRVMGNATFAAELSGVDKKTAQQNCRILLDVFGLVGKEKLWPFQLSGGMKRRVALLRSFLVPKPILLLDEPFSSLDTLTRTKLGYWLESVWRDDGRTLVLVTHDISEALMLADKIVVLGSDGIINHVEELNWPRPRNKEIRSSREFNAAYLRLESSLS